MALKKEGSKKLLIIGIAAVVVIVVLFLSIKFFQTSTSQTGGIDGKWSGPYTENTTTLGEIGCGAFTNVGTYTFTFKTVGDVFTATVEDSGNYLAYKTDTCTRDASTYSSSGNATGLIDGSKISGTIDIGDAGATILLFDATISGNTITGTYTGTGTTEWDTGTGTTEPKSTIYDGKFTLKRK